MRAALVERYAIQEELGAGGMATVTRLQIAGLRFGAGMFLALLGCTGGDSIENRNSRSRQPVPTILANNAFYYYEDVDAAEQFYATTLGLRTVSDFGFAKILQVAPTSYLTLVDADSGMHSSSEPKSVTLAIVTEQVENWYDHLTDAGVSFRTDLLVVDGRPHDGFVAIDPEGYFLEFERFNEHAENERLIPRLREIEPLTVAVGDGLTISATVLWLYYNVLSPIQRFYEQALGTRMIVDQGWAKVYPTSRTGFIGFVDGARGLHRATAEKGVSVSFFTDDVEAWFARMAGQPDFEFRTEELGDESGRVRTFVGYDPGRYFLEWDTFLDTPGNEELVALLERER
ncbi:MAG: VOC family protein [Gemmatimonadetes bacterium]|nr:VOC family protein [Gemmatimonadota bacterium]